MKAWVTGSAGLIGHYLLRAARSSVPDWTVEGLTRQHLDLLDFAAVRETFRRQQPDIVIHCAALSKTTVCQQDPDLARRLNVEVTSLLAELAAGIPFIFLSTDLVFDGQKGYYLETSPVNPGTVYGETKAAAEQAVLRHPRHTVVRTSLNYGHSLAGDRAFNEEIRRTWEAGQPLRLFTDEFRTPIAAEETARFLWELARLRPPGIYHLAGTERLSRCEIGQLLAVHWPDVQARIVPASLRDYQGPPRAPDTSLDCSKVGKILSAPLPSFSEWLKQAPRWPAPF